MIELICSLWLTTVLKNVAAVLVHMAKLRSHYKKTMPAEKNYSREAIARMLKVYALAQDRVAQVCGHFVISSGVAVAKDTLWSVQSKTL